MQKLLGSLFFLLLIFHKIQAQDDATLYSIQFNLPAVTNFNELPAFDFEAMKNEDLNSRFKGDKGFRFAKSFDVQFTPENSGTWYKLPGNRKAWRLGIRSKSAYSLYISLQDFHLNEGARLFVYNANESDFAGPYTSKVNNQRKIFSIRPVPGDAIIIEIDVSGGTKNYGSFEISQVWHDYRNAFGESKLKSEKSVSSGVCNVDVDCAPGIHYPAKYAVCSLIVNGFYCTGSMINNVRGDKTPYLLTAYHCIQNESIANGAQIFFDYELPYCGATDWLPAKEQVGATLVATTPNQLDFSLIKLDNFPNITTRAYLAGWNASPSRPAGGFCIHHPLGDVKKISIDYDTLTTGSFGEGFNDNSSWVVGRWDVGVTEGGSSGGPFFNNNQQIVGTLTGGDAVCGSPVNDFFNKFSLAWNYYPDSSKQLRHWLDPDNTGATELPGTDPYGFNDINCDTLSNLFSAEHDTLSKADLAWGYISGQNSSGFESFAEKFTSADTVEIPGVFLNVAKLYKGNITSYITVNVWTGNTVPESMVYSNDYYFYYLKNNATNFIAFDSILRLKDTFFIGYTVNYMSPADTFAVYHAPNRGSTGLSTLYVYKNNAWSNISELTTPEFHTSLDISFPGCTNLNLHLKVNDRKLTKLNLYPNPCATYLNIDLPENFVPKLVKCFNIVGISQQITYEITGTKLKVLTGNLPNGVYFLSLYDASNCYSNRFIISK